MISNGSKHKVNLSVDNPHGSNHVGQPHHNKHISMNGLPYEKVKGLTPVNGKTSHLKNYQDEGDNIMGGLKGNSRNNGGRMPNLP